MNETQTRVGAGIIDWFARNSVAANLLLITTIVLGLLSLNDLRKEAFPSLDPDRVTVSVNFESGDPQQAEEGIALKVEEALESVAGIERITSTSDADGSKIVIEKLSSYDLDKLYEDVKSKVDAISDFPSDADNPVIEKATRQEHAIWVQFYGQTDRATLQSLAERLKSDLLAKPAIRDLEIKAKADSMIAIELDEVKLQAYGLTFSDISEAINAESAVATSTSLRNSEKVVSLKVSEQAYEQQAFANINLLTQADGSFITLGDVATISDTFSDDVFNLSRYNQQPGLAIEIVMDEYGDVTDIVDQANSVVEKWQNSNQLPSNVHLTTWYDASTIIKDRLSLLSKNALSGIALVFVILAIFLNLKVAFWVAAGLPFVFFGTLYLMGDNYTALTINEMTTFGFIMALGIVVDDAVVVGESIYSTRSKEGDNIENTIRGTLKVAVPTIFGVLTTVAAFLTLANIEGHLGQIYAQFGTVVMLCLLLSMVESKLILPSHLAHLKTQQRSDKKSLWSNIQHKADSSLQWFSEHIYQHIIKMALNYRYAVLIIFLAIFILVIGMPFTGKVKVSFFPDVEGDTIRSEITMYDDASFGQNRSALLTIEQAAIAADNNLIKKYGQSQSQILSLQVSAESDSIGNVTVEIDADSIYSSAELQKEWKRLAGKPEGVKKISIKAKKGLVDNFKVELKAYSTETVLAAGATMKEALLNIKGVSGIDDNITPGIPQYRFRMTTQGRTLGLTTAQLSEQILLSFAGATVQNFQRDNNEVKVQVRYPEQKRQTLADVENSMVHLDDGTTVPLTSVAEVYSEYQQSDITRINNLRAVYISADVDKEQIASNQLVANLKADVVPQLLAQHSNLVIDFAGEAEQQAETQSSMGNMFMVALLLIYVLLAIPLKSYVQPLLIMMAIPFGIVGAILGHYINGLTLSILSLFGILALSGVVVNDSLLLVSRFNELLEKYQLPVKQAIIEACTGRLRAVFLTSLTTFAGLMPLLSETSFQAQFLIPAAASLGYGILFATVITLILIPALLLIHFELKAFLGRPFKSKTKAVTLSS